MSQTFLYYLAIVSRKFFISTNFVKNSVHEWASSQWFEAFLNLNCSYSKSKKVQTEHKRSNLQMAGCVLDPQVDRNYYLYVLAFGFTECNNITSPQPHHSVVTVKMYIVWTIDTSIQIITERTEKRSVCRIVFYWLKGEKTAPKWPKWYKARRRENLINQKNQRQTVEYFKKVTNYCIRAFDLDYLFLFIFI